MAEAQAKHASDGRRDSGGADPGEPWSRLRGLVARHVVADAPDDLAAVEAAIDRSPARGVERLGRAAIVGATLLFWGGIAALILQ